MFLLHLSISECLIIGFKNSKLIEREYEVSEVLQNHVPFLVLKGNVSTSAVNVNKIQAVEKRPSAAFPSSFVVATYTQVRLTPQDFGRLASGHF